jgi:hypothetical protein
VNVTRPTNKVLTWNPFTYACIHTLEVCVLMHVYRYMHYLEAASSRSLQGQRPGLLKIGRHSRANVQIYINRLRLCVQAKIDKAKRHLCCGLQM